jgi:hypothetical protein
MTVTSPAILQGLPGDSDALRSASVGYLLEHTEVGYAYEKKNSLWNILIL